MSEIDGKNYENFYSEKKSTRYFLEQEELRQKLLWNVKREVKNSFEEKENINTDFILFNRLNKSWRKPL